MSKKKVMIMANDTTYTYNLRNEIIERLISEGCEVEVLAEGLLKKEKLRSLGCRLIEIKTNRRGTNPLSDLGLYQNFKKILRKERPDVVLTYNIKPNVYGGMACEALKIPYIANITGLGTAVEYPGLLQRITTRLYKFGVAGATCIMFQNEENRKFFEERGMMPKAAEVVLLPGSGVSLKIHKPMEYPSEQDGLNFLFIARVMAEKGIDLYLGAAKRIHEKHPDTRFHICGFCDDEKYISLLKKCGKSGYIIYHGEQKDMLPFFEQTHCVVHPSHYPEGMSNVLLEAAAHCRPVITTDRAGCRETVDREKSGFVIPVRDEDALVEALEKFIALGTEERKKMGLAGRKKIEREFDRKIVAEAYATEIERITGKDTDS